MIAIVAFIVFLLIVRMVYRRSKLMNLQLKPYRYPVDSRRSRWANRLGY